jgi:hypothetical protein
VQSETIGAYALVLWGVIGARGRVMIKVAVQIYSDSDRELLCDGEKNIAGGEVEYTEWKKEIDEWCIDKGYLLILRSKEVV